MKSYLIINPWSRGGKCSRQFGEIFRLMNDAGLEYDYVFASTFQGIKGASVYANRQDYDNIIAVGGDGTINAVINGFYDQYGYLISNKSMGVIYTGTSPDFCKSYGIPLNLEEAVNSIKNHQIKRVRIGSIRFASQIDPVRLENRYFACCTSIGIGAMVAAKANRFRKYVGDFAGTIGSILICLAKFKSRNIEINSSGTIKTYRSVVNVFVGRTKYIASGIKVNQGISENDPRFYIITVMNLRLSRLLNLFCQIYSGDIKTSNMIDFSLSDSVLIQSDKLPSQVEFDGDPAGFTPCTFQCAVNSLNLITWPDG